MDEAYTGESSGKLKKEAAVYYLFKFSILGKGLLSIFEILAAAATILIPPGVVLSVVDFLTRGELVEDPTSFVATHLNLLASEFASSALFIAVYLFSRGIIKLFLVFALLKNMWWAYPVSLVVLGLFVLFQLSQLYAHFSLLILLLTAFDLIVIFFIWKEYQIVKAHGGRVIE
ncbi:MAG: DUF2127 domain-containing protein [Minisyncoccia bacterium]